MNDFVTKLNTALNSDTLVSLKQYAQLHNVPIMRENTASLLTTLVRLKNPKTILEIGTAIGYSGVLFLTHSTSSRLYTMEIDEASYNVAKQNFANFHLSDRVVQMLGDAYDILSVATGKYEMIFLDGPKSQYIEYLPYLINLLEVGGVLICDNVLFRGLVANLPDRKHPKYTIANKLNKFLNVISCDSNFDTTVLDVDDGISISVKVK